MDIASNLTISLLFIMIYLFVIIFSAKDKKLNGFVKGMIIICFSMRILFGIAFDILSNTLRVWEYWESDVLRELINSGWYFSYFILLYCLLFLIGESRANQLQINENILVDLKRRKIWLSLLLFFVTVGLYGLFWLYRTVKDLKSNFQEIPYTPGQAVGFLFIPLFNLYWMFRIIFSLPLYVARIERKYFTPAYRFQFHPVLISLLWIIFIIYTYIIGIEASTKLGDFSFELLLAATLFPTFSIWIILLTIQAKINSFADTLDNNKLEVSMQDTSGNTKFDVSVLVLGVLFGIVMLASVFVPWDPNTVLIRISFFLGIQNYSFDRLFGVDFLPILGTIFFILAIVLSRKHIAWRICALCTSSIVFVIASYTFIEYWAPGVGLWIFAITSILAVALSILLISKKNL